MIFSYFMIAKKILIIDSKNGEKKLIWHFLYWRLGRLIAK